MTISQALELRLALFYGRVPFNRAPRQVKLSMPTECLDGCGRRPVFAGYCEACAYSRLREVES